VSDPGSSSESPGPTVFPKEHGAYGQLLFPLMTALAVGRRTVPALMLGAAAVLAFLAHEPLIVLLGQRGPRAAREQRSRAIAWLVSTATGAGVLAIAALAIAPGVRVAAIIPALLAALLAVVIAARREHTIAGETLAAATFASLAYPVARAAGASAHAALSCASVFGALFVASTLCVHAVIQHTRRPPAAKARAAGAVVALGSIAVLRAMAAYGLVSSIAPVAAFPVCAVAALAALIAPSARRLRLLGWTLLVTTTLSALLLVAVFG
jgi:YwiC-like protein